LLPTGCGWSHELLARASSPPLDLFETSTVIVLATVREGEEPEILTQYF